MRVTCVDHLTLLYFLILVTNDNSVLIIEILITYVISFHQHRVNSPHFSPDILMNRHSKPTGEAIQNKTQKNISVSTVTRLKIARPDFVYGGGHELLSLLRLVRTGSEAQPTFQLLNR